MERVGSEGKKVGGHNKVPDAVRDAIIADRKDGLSWNKVVKKYRVGITTVRRICFEAGLPRKTMTDEA